MGVNWNRLLFMKFHNINPLSFDAGGWEFCLFGFYLKLPTKDWEHLSLQEQTRQIYSSDIKTF